MDEIKVGDVFWANEKYKYFCFKLPVAILYVDEYDRCYILTPDGEITQYTKRLIRTAFHKIGHIGKFTEALKELEEMAKNS